MKKRLISLIITVMLLVTMAASAMAAAPTVKKVEYEGGKKVEVEFKGRVSYKNPDIIVKDSKGSELSARILKKDNDDISFSVSGLKAGEKYTFTLTGVRAGSSGSFGSVKGSFTIPAKVAIRKVIYDSRDHELDIDFNGKVKYKNVRVSVKDASGKAYTAKITEKGDDDLEVRVTGLKKGKTYKVTVSGVALKGGSFITVSKSFTVK